MVQLLIDAVQQDRKYAKVVMSCLSLGFGSSGAHGRTDGAPNGEDDGVGCIGLYEVKTSS